MRRNDLLNQLCRWLAERAAKGGWYYERQVLRYSETVFNL